jgi:23S rRNA (guanosine2251-2'-O)-methyltransferase
MKLTNLNAIEETIRARSMGLLLYVDVTAAGRARAIANQATAAGIRVSSLKREELHRLVPGQDCRGLVLELAGQSTPALSLADLGDRIQTAVVAGQQPIVLALDGITDPHNLGAIIRSADQFGALAVVIPERRAAQGGPVVHAASAGAVAWVPLITVKNLVRALEELKALGLWCIGSDMAGLPAHQRQLNCPVLLVMGSEGSGLSPLVARTCDELVRIPTNGQVDSLNVSNACAVLLYELQRQRNFGTAG